MLIVSNNIRSVKYALVEPMTSQGCNQHIASVPTSQGSRLRRLPMMYRIAKLSNPPQFTASLIVLQCHCCKRRPRTQSHTALTAAKQRQPPWSAASSQPNKHAATPGRHHSYNRFHVSSATPVKLAILHHATLLRRKPIVAEPPPPAAASHDHRHH